ncbi:MAG: pyrroline-5-carboxylate reductase [Clostridium perfringens]|nr:pyrroline-5-carboxylate reductase [Clostridium perfringens]
MNKKIGFVGCGNMGSAMVGGIINSNLVNAKNIIASCKRESSAKNLAEKFNIKTTLNNVEVCKESDIVFLAVKPYMYKDVIREIRDYIDDEKIIVTIAAGVTLAQVEEWFNKDVKIVKTMPNTPALVGEAMTAICANKNVIDNELDMVISIFDSFGKSEVLEEKYFHAFTALCGSSPAYVYMFIEAMADAAVKQGLPRDKAYKMASQAVLGSAKMVLETGENPGKLKDNVCSPGGTTIEAVIELERQGFRNAVISAIEKCEEKSKSM